MPDLMKVRALDKRCLLYTSDAADERSSVDLGGRRIIKKKNTKRVHIMRSRTVEARTLNTEHKLSMKNSMRER